VTDSYDLVVFDWDGTLMDSIGRIVTCIEAAAAYAGLAAPTPEAARDIIGLGLRESVLRLFPGADDPAVDRIIEGYRHHFLGDDITPSVLFEGAEAVLTDLNEAGVLLAVATGKSRRGLQKELDATGLGEYFAVTRCADETFSKPHPQMLLEVMEVTGTEPARTLMVGDTEYDMQMAANAGTTGLGVGYGVHAPERLLAAGAVGCLNAIVELPPWLANGAGQR
jgi:phosphoglycolate phosphatase